MESIYDDQSDPSIGARAARDAVHAAQQRLANRLRSPWWFHALIGLAVAAVVFGITGRTPWGIIVLVAGIVGYVVLGRWRARSIGFSRADPERWAFLRTGAPWSVVSLVVVVAAIAAVLFVRQLSLPEVGAVAVAAGFVTAVLGPLADRAGRAALGRDGR
ncbi:hypothetical protein [Curtobacterium sp. RRHDQ10]|uniref:hypothetical protein n=1 Tax=Curtobacterium phyllosphaerae TaxID=3413379 RepID=UPI003BF065BC